MDNISMESELKKLQKENRILRRNLLKAEMTITATEQNRLSQKNIFDMIKWQKEQQDIYLELVFEYNPDIIIVIDSDYKIIKATANSLRKYGVVFDPVAENSVIDVFEPFLTEEQNQRFNEAVRTVIEQGIIKKYNEIEIQINNKIYTLEVFVVPLVNKLNDTIGALVGLHDMTDFRHALSVAERESKAKSAFLAKVSHEIRTPMNAILGLAELILRGDLSNEHREHVMGIKYSGNYLLSIINDILDFSKIEADKIEITPYPYSVTSILDYTVGILKTKVIDKPILFTVDVNPNIPENLIGDEVRISQMVLNLLSNAFKYNEKGFVKFKISHGVIDDETIMMFIEVSDSGIGIRKKDLSKLFGDFVQLGETVGGRGVEGSGLGLAITRGFANAMGGELLLESEYGVGSTFRLAIPQKINMQKREVFAKIDKPGKVPVILLYETREVYAESLAASLKNLMIPADSVTNHADFIINVKKNRYDFIFISSFVYDSVQRTLNKLNYYDTKIIIVAAYGDKIAKSDTGKVLLMPAHSADIADIINNHAKHAPKEQKSGVKFTASSARALVTDDISTNLMIADGFLSLYGITTDTCKSGMQAIELVLANHYDIVFMDHMMPDMDGVETVSHIRGLHGTPKEESYYRNLPIVAVTANAVAGMREMFLNNGFNDFMAKPLNLGVFESVIEKWLPYDKIEMVEGGSRSEGFENHLPLLEIEGIDVKEGVRMNGGNIENYIKTLGAFREDVISKIKEIDEALEKGDLHSYAIYAHALKGASASIGAAELSESARLLENAARVNDEKYIANNNEYFSGELVALLERIKVTLESINSAQAQEFNQNDIDFIVEHAIKFYHALEELDMEVINNELVLLRTKSNSEMVQTIDEILNSILIFEYEKANDLIESFVGYAGRLSGW